MQIYHVQFLKCCMYEHRIVYQAGGNLLQMTSKIRENGLYDPSAQWSDTICMIYLNSDPILSVQWYDTICAICTLICWYMMCVYLRSDLTWSVWSAQWSSMICTVIRYDLCGNCTLTSHDLYSNLIWSVRSAHWYDVIWSVLSAQWSDMICMICTVI